MCAVRVPGDLEVTGLPKLAVVALVLALALPALGAGASGSGRPACSHGYRRSREIAHGRFLGRRWELRFFRDRKERPCLSDGWGPYGSIFRFRVHEGRPRLGILNLEAPSRPDGPGAYVFEGYVQKRVARATFTIDGRTRDVRIVRSPRWTGLPKNLVIHFVRTRRYNRDARGRLRVFDREGRLLATRVLRRRQFYKAAEPQ